MSLSDFISKYPDEESCKAEWKKYRKALGIWCRNCLGKRHYWKEDKECFECKKCGYRQSLRRSTIMHGSQLPFRYWLITIELLKNNENFSVSELQRELGHSTYNPIHAMVRKLRLVKAKAEKQRSTKSVKDTHKIITFENGQMRIIKE